jgi:hypothetical protein
MMSSKVAGLRAKIITLSIALVLSACEAQVREANTSSADTIEPIYRDEVLNNLSKLLDTPNILPSQAKLGTGQNQSSGTFSPIVTFPLSSMFASTVSAMSGHTTSTAGAGATLGGNLGYQLTYQTAPITEVTDLMNLRAIYMAVLCSGDVSNTAISADCASFDLKEAYTPPRLYDSQGKLVFDGYFLQPPICILCLDPATISSMPSSAFVAVNKNSLGIVDILRRDNKWLYWVPTGAAGPAGTVYIGQAGGKRFYSKSLEKFADFILKTLPLPVSPGRTMMPAVTLAPPVPAVEQAPQPSEALQLHALRPQRNRPAPPPPVQVPLPKQPAPPPSVQVPLLVPGSPEGGRITPSFVQPFPPIQ